MKLFTFKQKVTEGASQLNSAVLTSPACYTGNLVCPVWPQKCRSGIYWPSVCNTMLQCCDEASWIFYHYYVCSSRPVICFSNIFFEVAIKNYTPRTAEQVTITERAVILFGSEAWSPILFGSEAWSPLSAGLLLCPSFPYVSIDIHAQVFPSHFSCCCNEAHESSHSMGCIAYFCCFHGNLQVQQGWPEVCNTCSEAYVRHLHCS